MYRLISNLLIILALLVGAHKVLAYENDFALKGGFIFAESKFNKLDDDAPEYEEREETKSFGVHTSFSYTWTKVETGFESRITLGKEAQLSFSSKGETIEGRGSIRSVDITPFVKVRSKTFHFPQKVQSYFNTLNLTPWYAYFKLGPSWMIQSVNLDKFSIDAELRENHKISYESVGFSLSIGIEEDLTYKTEHPCFFEVSVSAYESYKVSLVDTTDSKEINILEQRDAKQDIKTFQLMFIIGMTFF
ncbi:hypothetical protein [Bacteriovorax sp. Seq25_V]|uniref:hypothetical protein n=1 Tax=Bacteriovorax sp. Seq25_V TaxID=1201288 RepID=UPI000389DB95|nr:hypothetical protein [Bacteriovorax sp. Seq25_V]EQC46051.1 hypothetical protein M900_1702 [Bacteriovorax sp. Seq25_V]